MASSTGHRDATRQYITCDGLITPTFLADGIAVSVGRTQRIIPERTRRIVQLRDGGCRVPPEYRQRQHGPAVSAARSIST